MDTSKGRSPDRSASARALDTSVDFLGLVGILLRRRWTVLICLLLFTGLGATALYLISPRYTATSRIFVDPREQRTVKNEIVQSGTVPDMALVESQVEVITSEAVLKRVVQNSNLAADPEFGAKAGSSRDPAVAALETLARATAVTRPENTYVLQISVTTKEAAKSARLANAVASAYLDYQAETSADTARTLSGSIRDRLAQLEDELNKSEEAVEAFKRDHNVSEVDGRLLGDRSLNDLSTRRSTAIANVNETKTRLEVMQQALRSRGDVSNAVSGTDTAMSALRTQLAEAQRDLAELRQVLGARHPRVAAAEAQVSQAQSTIRAESERLVQAAKDNYREAVDTLNAVNKEFGNAQTASFDTNQDLIKLRELERKAQSNKVVYESFLLRAKETSEQENISTHNARIIAEAAIPVSPAYPPRVPLLAGAALLGLFIGIPAALLHDLLAAKLAARRSPPLPADPDMGAVADVNDGLVAVYSARDLELTRKVAVHLAREAASAGRNAVLVDLAYDAPADLPGLAELATGEATVASAVRIDPETKLQVLNAGSANAIARLSRERADFMLGVLVQEYDDVIVNAGPLDDRTTVLADLFGEHARRKVLVVREGGYGLRERRMADGLRADGKVAVWVMPVEDEARAA